MFETKRHPIPFNPEETLRLGLNQSGNWCKCHHKPGHHVRAGKIAVLKLFTREHQISAGKVSGRKAVETGRVWEALRKSRHKRGRRIERIVFEWFKEVGFNMERNIILGEFEADLLYRKKNLVVFVDGSCWTHPASCDIPEECSVVSKMKFEMPEKYESRVLSQLRRNERAEKSGYDVLMLPPHNPRAVFEEWWSKQC